MSILIFSVLSFIFFFQNKKNKDYRLVVSYTSWSGLEGERKSEIETKEYDVVLGRKYEINSGSLGLVLVIEKINNNNIVIKTTEVFSDKKDGIDLNTNKKEFKIYLNEELKLATPTMDAGKKYSLTFKIKDKNNG